MINRTYGWRPSLPDHRDFRFAAISPRLMDVPKVVYLMRPPVRDQGQEGSCVFQAIATDMEYVELANGVVEPVIYSRQYAYYRYREWLAEMNHEPALLQQDTGACIRDAIKVTARQGVCRESLWPYIPREEPDTNFAKRPSAEAQADAAKRTVKSYFSLRSVDEMVQCLAARFGFFGGLSVFESFDSDEVARTGLVPLPGKGERLLGGHAVWFWGYDLHKGVFLGQNSYGPEWGREGRFEIPMAYLGNPDLATDFWTVRE